jgi:hypothetical protein
LHLYNPELHAAFHNIKRIAWKMYKNHVEKKYHPQSQVMQNEFNASFC